MANPKTAYTVKQVATMLEMRAVGANNKHIGETIGKSSQSVWAKFARLDNPGGVPIKVSTTVNQSAKKLQKQVPIDTRTISQIICGEPLPGRSAFDKLKAKVDA